MPAKRTARKRGYNASVPPYVEPSLPAHVIGDLLRTARYVEPVLDNHLEPLPPAPPPPRSRPRFDHERSIEGAVAHMYQLSNCVEYLDIVQDRVVADALRLDTPTPESLLRATREFLKANDPAVELKGCASCGRRLEGREIHSLDAINTWSDALREYVSLAKQRLLAYFGDTFPTDGGVLSFPGDGPDAPRDWYPFYHVLSPPSKDEPLIVCKPCRSKPCGDARRSSARHSGADEYLQHVRVRPRGHVDPLSGRGVAVSVDRQPFTASSVGVLEPLSLLASSDERRSCYRQR